MDVLRVGRFRARCGDQRSFREDLLAAPPRTLIAVRNIGAATRRLPPSRVAARYTSTSEGPRLNGCAMLIGLSGRIDFPSTNVVSYPVLSAAGMAALGLMSRDALSRPSRAGIIAAMHRCPGKSGAEAPGKFCEESFD